MIASLVLAATLDVPETESSGIAIDFDTALLFAILVCLAFIAKNLADLNRRVEDAAAERTAPARGAGGTGAALEAPAGGIDPVILAAISAAVFATVDWPVRIVSVDEVHTEQSRTWSLEGRRQIFSSHALR